MTDTDSPPLMFLLLAAAHGLGERLEAAFAAVGLSAARFGVLDELARSEGSLTLGEIAARQSCHRSNMTQLVDRLEAEGLVKRSADPNDRRSVRAEITTLGLARRVEGSAIVNAEQARLDEVLSPCDRERLAQILSSLVVSSREDS